MSKMIPVSEDMLAYVGELANRRIVMVMGKRAQRLGGMLNLKPHEERDLTFARSLHARFAKGDYRMSQDEWNRLRDVGRWLQRVHEENHAMEPKPFPVINEAGLWRSEVLPPGSYNQQRRRVAEDDLGV